MIPKQCAILLGGAGTRLRELTREVPKPLLNVGGRPFLQVLVDEALRRGFRDILLLAGYKAGVAEAFVSSIRSKLPADCTIKLSVEPEPLGTGGALVQALHLLHDRFLLLNGDTWFDFNWLDLARVARDGSGVAARQLKAAKRYESLRIVEDGRVAEIIPRGQATGSALVNGGVYVLSKQHVVGCPARFSVEDELLPKLAARGVLRGQPYKGFFLDIGTPESFADAQVLIPQRHRRPAVFFDRDGVLNHDDNYVGAKEDLRWIDGAKKAVRLANDLGYYVFVVTNQAGVAKGFYQEQDVQALHAWMAAELRQSGGWVDDWRYCPFHPEGSVEQYRHTHPWRKPSPGMLLDIMGSWPVLLEGSILVGDQESDMRAANAAGIKPILFTGGNLYDFVEPRLRAASDQWARSGRPNE